MSARATVQEPARRGPEVAERTDRVVVFVEYYLPGFKAGGPLRSIAALVSHVGGEFDFRILTRCHDDGDARPYDGVRVDRWNAVGKAHVFYASDRLLTIGGIIRLVRQAAPDIVYLNSYFAPLTRRFMIARRLGLAPRVPVLVAPRGEFSEGALELKRLKKKVYLKLARGAGLYEDVTWQASSDLEESEIKRALGSGARVKVAPDLTAPPQDVPELGERPAKRTGAARFVFVSRISRKKNLDFALRQLAGLEGDVVFDIYGPVGEPEYWEECLALSRSLPANVHVEYHGAIPYEEVAGVLARNHFFLLPTRGENFGHAIFEALAAGCPPLISDRTPWLASDSALASWIVPLEDTERWRRQLQRCVSMGPEEYADLSAAARRVAQDVAEAPAARLANQALLAEMLEGSATRRRPTRRS